jgi:hypothetical protein
VKHGHGLPLQRVRLFRVRHVGDLLDEASVLRLGVVGKFLLLLLLLALGSRLHLLRDGGDLLLRQVPLQVARPVVASETFHVRDGFDIGELAGLALLQRGQELRQGGLVVLPCLFHLETLGLKGAALVSGLPLALVEVAVAIPLAFGKIFLRLAWEGLEAFLFLGLPRRRRLDGRKLRFGCLGLLSGDRGLFDPGSGLVRWRG